MSDPVRHMQSQRHTLSDWLELHELDQLTCLHVIDAIGGELESAPIHQASPHRHYQALDHDGTWSMTIAAMRAFLPAHQDSIVETFRKSEKIAVVRSHQTRRALTIDHGPSRFPTILYSFRNDASDPLVVAHEFGHALQIRASGGNFVSPILREMCAFLAEGALLSYGMEHGVPQYDAMLERWRKDNQRYFGHLAQKLRTALSKPNAAYEYGWNYPIARFIALKLSRNCPVNSLWGAFEGSWSVPSLLRESGL